MHMTIFQTFSSVKPIGQPTPDFIWSLLGKGDISSLKWSRSHDQDGRHEHIWPEPLKIFFFGTRSPMILKLGMGPLVTQGLQSLYINDDPGILRQGQIG